MSEKLPNPEALKNIQIRWDELQELKAKGEISNPEVVVDEIFGLADKANIPRTQLFEILYPKKEQK